jgi:hypothetical protein
MVGQTQKQFLIGSCASQIRDDFNRAEAERSVQECEWQSLDVKSATEDGDAGIASRTDHVLGSRTSIRECRVDVEHGGDAHPAVGWNLADDGCRPVERDPQQQDRSRCEGSDEEEPPQPPPAWLQGTRPSV